MHLYTYVYSFFDYVVCLIEQILCIHMQNTSPTSNTTILFNVHFYTIAAIDVIVSAMYLTVCISISHVLFHLCDMLFLNITLYLDVKHMPLLEHNFKYVHTVM